MFKPWNKDGKSGSYQFTEGLVIYQKPVKGTIVKEPLYQADDGQFYIEVDGKLQWVLYNGFNGYCYRQDGE